MRTSPWRYAAGLILIAALSASLGCGRRSVGSVNGNKISQDSFYKRLQRFPIAPQVSFPPPIQQQAAAVVLQQMISEQLMLDLAKKEGVLPTDQQLKQRKRELNGSLTDDGRDLTALLNQSGMSHQELDERLKPDLAQMNVLAKYIKVTEDEVKKAYQQATDLPNDKKFTSMFFVPESVHLLGILNKDKDKIVKAQKQLANGISFGVVAEQYSEDPTTRRKRGEIGWIPKPDPVRPAIQGVPPEIYEKAFSLKVGETSEPFQAGGQWVLLRVEDKRPAKMKPYEHVKGVIRDRILQSKAASNDKVKKVFDDFQKDAKINVTIPAYKALFKQIAEQLAPKPGATTTTPSAPKPGN